MSHILKRLIVAALIGCTDFSRNFRNEGMDRTQSGIYRIEFYVAYKDYLDDGNHRAIVGKKTALDTNEIPLYK